MASLLHSAEGSTWKKRNHKYLYKEGNRYIYPEDVQRRGGGGGIQRTKNKTARDILSDKGVRRVERGNFDDGSSYRRIDRKDKNGNYNREYQHPYKSKAIVLPGDRYDVNYHYSDERKANKEKADAQARQAQNRANAGSGRPDYKKLSEQHANREAARNGKVVNPTYTLRDDKGNKVARLQSKDKVQMPTVADYKKASQLTSGAKNRKKMVDKQGSVNYKELSRDHADQARELKRMGEDHARKKARGKLVRKGVDAFGNEYTGRGGKAYDVITNSREGRKRYDKASGERISPDMVNHRKDVLNKQGSKQYKYDGELYGIRDKNGRSGLRNQASQQDAKEMSKIHRNSSYQQALRDSNKAENNKLKNRIKNKGKKALDSIFRKRSKKK